MTATLRDVIIRRYVHHLANGTVAQEIERMQMEIENMTKKKIEMTTIEPGESATVGTREVTNTSEQTVHVGVSDEQLAREAEEEAAADWALLHGTKTQSDGSVQHLKTPDLRLKHIVEDLIDMQHARAAAGNGTATHWQNAQAHIRKAIECIEQQAADDTGMAKPHE